MPCMRLGTAFSRLSLALRLTFCRASLGLMRAHKLLVTLALAFVSIQAAQAETNKKVNVQVRLPNINPLPVPVVEYYALGTAKQIFEQPKGRFRPESHPIILRGLIHNSTVRVENPKGQVLRTLLYVAGQQELRISDLDPAQKYTLVVIHPDSQRELKIENVPTGQEIQVDPQKGA